MEYEEIIDMVVGELTQRTLSQLREEDETLDQKITKRIELRGQIEKSIAILDESQQQIFHEYFDIALDITGVQEEYLYLQGAKDCVRLLKGLGVL